MTATMIRVVALLAALVLPVQAWAQAGVQQGGPWTAGHVPMYGAPVGASPVIVDSGPASGGIAGVGLTELNLTIRGTGTAPYADQGTGPLYTNSCNFDGPTSGAYHWLCSSPNAGGGGLLAYGATGGAADLPFNFTINGGTPITIDALSFTVNTGTTVNLPAGSISPSALTAGLVLDLSNVTPVQGQLYYYNGTNLVGLSPGSAGQVLITGGAAADPSWSTVTGTGTVTSVTCGTGLSGGTFTGSGTCALTTPVTVATGGTGVTSLTAHTLIVGNGTSAPTLLAPGTNGFCLKSNGAAADPSYQSCTSTSGTVTSITAGSGLSGGTITVSGTVAVQGYILAATAASLMRGFGGL